MLRKHQSFIATWSFVSILPLIRIVNKDCFSGRRRCGKGAAAILGGNGRRLGSGGGGSPRQVERRFLFLGLGNSRVELLTMRSGSTPSIMDGLPSLPLPTLLPSLIPTKKRTRWAWGVSSRGIAARGNAYAGSRERCSLAECRGSASARGRGAGPLAEVWENAPSIHAEHLGEECYDAGEEDEKDDE